MFRTNGKAMSVINKGDPDNYGSLCFPHSNVKITLETLMLSSHKQTLTISSFLWHIFK